MSGKPATVLVVDDDPLNRAMLSMSLGAEGHEVREAGNGREAIAVLAEHAIDVVLTDIEMPEMDGYGLLEHRRGDDRLKAIPFIVISGVEEMDSIVACIKLGAEDYLPKPFDPVLLHARLGACLDRKRMTDELLEWNTRLAERVEEKVARWSGSTGCGASSRRSSPRRSPPAATPSSRATAARSPCSSATCAASPRSPRPPSPKR